MPRPRGFDEEKVLKSVMATFWRKGYTATSAEDLVQASGLGRSSLYNAFSSKEVLFEKALTCYFQHTRDTALALAEPGTPSTTLIRALLLSTLELEATERKIGCLVTNTAIERAGQDQHVASLLHRHFDLLKHALTRLIKQGQSQGEINAAFDATALAGLILATMQGLRVLAKSSGKDGDPYLIEIVDQAILVLR